MERPLRPSPSTQAQVHPTRIGAGAAPSDKTHLAAMVGSSRPSRTWWFIDNLRPLGPAPGERELDDLDAGLISTIADEARCYLLEDWLGRLQVERFLD
jgi:hypothetical protein